MKKTMTAALAVVLAALVAACGGSEVAAPPTVPVADVSVTASVDWEARTVEVTGLDGYEIRFCEGEAPVLCVSRGGDWVGAIELVSFPDGGSLLGRAVEAWAAELYDSTAADRAIGCGPAYDIVGDDPEPEPFAGGEGHRYGFTGTVNGRVVERTVGHVAVIDGDLHLLVVNALADDGCLGRESEVPVDAVDDLETVLAALAAGSTNLPDVDVSRGAGEADGPRSGWLRGSGERFVDIDEAVVLSGHAAVDAARADGQLPPDGQLPNDVYVDDDDAAVTILPVADRLTVELYDCTSGCKLRPVDAADFLAGRTQPFGGQHAFVSVDVRAGEVVHLREVYLP
jgi:hypothetical protein